MNVPLLLAGIVLVGLLYVILPVVGDAYVRFRGRRGLRCPETGAGADVELALGPAVLGAVCGRPIFRIGWCSLWPERRGCAQGCLPAAAGAEPERSPATRRV